MALLKLVKCDLGSRNLNYKRILFIAENKLVRSRQVNAIKQLVTFTKQKYCEQLDKVVVKLGLLQKQQNQDEQCLRKQAQKVVQLVFLRIKMNHKLNKFT